MVQEFKWNLAENKSNVFFLMSLQENGTSRRIVGPQPLHRDITPPS